jgi:hypothetical protein
VKTYKALLPWKTSWWGITKIPLAAKQNNEPLPCGSRKNSEVLSEKQTTKPKQARMPMATHAAPENFYLLPAGKASV